MTISTTCLDRASIEFHPAPDALKPFTGCFWILSAEAGATIRLVPDGTVAIALEVPPRGRPAWQLRGPLLRPAERRFAAPTTTVGVRLRPGVGFLVTGVPAHTLVDRSIDLASIDSAPETAADAIDGLQRWLIDRLRGATVHPLVAAALRELSAEGGAIPIPNLSARCGVTARHLHRLMRRWVGYGPKRYAAIVRFQSTLGRMEEAPGQPAAALASDGGYFDQAHLALEVGRFAGATPGRLRAQAASDLSKTRCDDLP